MSSLRQGADAARWTASSMIFATVVQFVQLIVLSRILSPAEYGIMGMIMVVVGIAAAFGDMGISNFVFHKEKLNPEQLSGLFSLNVVSGVAIWLLLEACSPLMAAIFDESRMIGPLYLVSLIFLLAPLGQLHQMLLQKEARFRELASFEIVANTLAFVTAITLATQGYGVYALVWSQIVNSGAKSVLFFIRGRRSWKVKFVLRMGEIREYVRFGSYQIGEKTIHFVSSNFDYFLIGRFFGAEALGIYSFAYNLAIMPVLKINPILTQVALPALAKVHESKERLKSGYYRLLRILSTINAPIYAGLIVTAPSLIPAVFGEKWTAAVSFVQILAAMGFFRSMISPVNTLLVSMGRVDLGFRWTATIVCVLIPCICVGAYFGGAEGIAFAFLVCQGAFFILKYFRVMRRLFDTSIKEYLSSAAPAVVYSVLTAIAVSLIPIWFELPSFPVLIAQLSIGVIAYGALNAWFNPSIMNIVKEAVLKKESGAQAPAKS